MLSAGASARASSRACASEPCARQAGVEAGPKPVCLTPPTIRIAKPTGFATVRRTVSPVPDHDSAPHSSAPPPEDANLLAAPFPRPRKLSEEIQRLIERFSEHAVTLREIVVTLQGRAYDLLILLLALPFLLPIPTPGLSSAFGLVVAIIAARMTCGQRPWLPARLLDTKLPPRFFPRLLGGARRIVRVFETLLRPRLPWLTASPLLIQLHAFIILVAAIVLLLPLPPGTNFPPAICIVVMAAGLLERDGLFVLAGYVSFALNLVFFALFAFYGTKLFEVLWQSITG